MPFDDQRYPFMVPAALSKPATAASLGALTDDVVRRIVLTPVKMGSVECLETTAAVTLRECAEYGRKKLSIGKFKKCSRCAAPFCNKECQKKNWKVHVQDGLRKLGQQSQYCN